MESFGSVGIIRAKISIKNLAYILHHCASRAAATDDHNSINAQTVPSAQIQSRAGQGRTRGKSRSRGSHRGPGSRHQPPNAVARRVKVWDADDVDDEDDDDDDDSELSYLLWLTEWLSDCATLPDWLGDWLTGWLPD